jgi:hypothetical protein
MGELEQAMTERMADIVFLEHRPFSFIDFLPEFEVNGKVYSIDYGTLRNKFSKLRKKGDIELDYRSIQAFYTIKGYKFGRSRMMTINPVGVPRNNDLLHKQIQNLPVGRNALHDIHLRFKVKSIWSVLSTNSAVNIDPINKDIRLPHLNIKGVVFKTTVHRTDTVSVVVACSNRPVAVDVGGIIRLSNALTRLEDRLSRVIDQCGDQVPIPHDSDGSKHDDLLVPDHGSWIVTMWHFGVDSLTEYTSDKFCVTWEAGENILIRAYTKDMKEKGKRIRLERQEVPNKNFSDAIEEKLNHPQIKWDTF